MPVTDDPGDPGLTKIDPETKMQESYLVLSQEELDKGFIRPVRTSYQHVGVRPRFATRELTPEEQERFAGVGYVAFEQYPQGSASIGRYWTQAQLDSGCGAVTKMGRNIAETYARDPKFYGGTYCVTCKGHFPVGEAGEFVWPDGSRVGS